MVLNYILVGCPWHVSWHKYALLRVLVGQRQTFLIRGHLKDDEVFFIILPFFSREIVTRWDGYFYWRRLSPFRFSRTYCKICKITCFSLRHSLPANPPRGGNLVPDDPRHKKMVSMTTNSKLNIYLREVCSRRQSSCRTNKNMKNNM